MKFIVCPFCKSHLGQDRFPRSRRSGGRVVMLCPTCRRRLAFTIREEEAQASQNNAEKGERNLSGASVETGILLHVIENVFGYDADFILDQGINRVGRYNDKNSILEVPVRTSDPSMDRNHCLITVQKHPSNGLLEAVIMDDDSMTGTFINTRELDPGEKHLLQDGDVITLGATSIIFSQKQL